MPRKIPIGQYLSEIVTKSISSWTFIAIYSLSMIAWILLHVFNVLAIDSLDFIKWNLFLSYFAGIQASIVLMSTERQSKIDRGRLYKHYQMDRETNEKIAVTSNQLKDMLEQLKELEDLIEEDDKDAKETDCDDLEKKFTNDAMGSDAKGEEK